MPIVKTITSFAEFERLRQEWNDLLAGSLRPTVFGSWEWQYHIARQFVPEKELYVLTAFDPDGILIGILPLRHTTIRAGGLMSMRVVQPIGGSITDYNPLIVGQNCLSAVVRSFTDHIAHGRLTVDLMNVLPNSPLDIWGRYLERRGFHTAVYETKTALVSYLRGDYAGFIKSLKKKFRKALRNNSNVMEKAGGYTFHDETASQNLLSLLISLHTSRWETKGEGGVLSHQQVTDFHKALIDVIDKPFEIRFYTLRHESDLVAILYGFLMNNVFYAYLSGLDGAHTRISPGNMIIDYCLQRLYASGAGVFDMLRGDMKYKQTWATHTYDMQDKLYFAATMSGRCAYVNMKAIQAIKRCIPAVVKRKVKAVV